MVCVYQETNADSTSGALVEYKPEMGNSDRMGYRERNDEKFEIIGHPQTLR